MKINISRYVFLVMMFFFEGYCSENNNHNVSSIPSNLYSPAPENLKLQKMINDANSKPNSYEDPSAPEFEIPEFEINDDEADSEPEIKVDDKKQSQQSNEKNVKNISVKANGASNGTFNLFCRELIINARSDGASRIQFQHSDFVKHKQTLSKQEKFELNGRSKNSYCIGADTINLDVRSNGASRVIFNIMQGCTLEIESEKTNGSSKILYPNQSKKSKTNGFLDNLFDNIEDFVEEVGDGIENIFSNSNISNSSSSTSVMGNNSITQINGFKVQTINGAIYVNDNLIANANEDVDTIINDYHIVRTRNGEVHISSNNNNTNNFSNVVITGNGRISIGAGISPLKFLFFCLILVGVLKTGITIKNLLEKYKNQHELEKWKIKKLTEIKFHFLSNNTYNVTGDLTIHY